jgi:HPt (histidine-containing phosphotransfer) domain-containing protein
MTQLPDFDPPSWIREFREDGAEAEVREIVGAFVGENERRLEPLRLAVAAGDLTTLANLAHATKGSAGSFGAPRLHALAVELEARALAGEVADAAVLAAEIEVATARTHAAAMTYLGAGTS